MSSSQPDPSDRIEPVAPKPGAGTPGVVETPDGPVTPKLPLTNPGPRPTRSAAASVASGRPAASSSSRLWQMVVALMSVVLLVVGFLILVKVIELAVWMGIFFLALGVGGLTLMLLPSMAGQMARAVGGGPTDGDHEGTTR